MSNRIWLPEEDAVIRSERANHTPVPRIAERLGRPVPATYLRARKLGCLVQPKAFWTPEEEERCRQLLSQDPAPTDSELARFFNRTVASVRWKVKDLGFIGKRALGLPPGRKIRRERKAAARLEKAQQKAIARQEKAGEKLRRTLAVQMAQHLKKSERQAERLIQRDEKVRASLAADLEKGLSLLARRLALELKASRLAAARDERQARRAAVDAERLARATLRSAKREERDLRREKAEPRRARIRAEEPSLRNRRVDDQARQPSKALALSRSAQRPTARSPAKATAHSIAKPMRRPVEGDEARPVTHAAPNRALTLPTVVFDAEGALSAASKPPPPTITTGRGGWIRTKVVRKTPLPKTILNRDDALALSVAAKDAVAAFIAARGVTKATSDVSSLVNRLRSRGYVVIAGERGWVIDHRHALDNVEALAAFARARGIETSVVLEG